MPRLRAVWATAQLVLAAATAAWGTYLLLTTREVFWASGNYAACVFFLVGAFLFGRGHPDGRTVGVFGLAVFLITNVVLVFSIGGPDAVPALVTEEHRPCEWTPFGGAPSAQEAAGIDCSWKANLAFAIGMFTLAIAVLQGLLLLFGHGEPGEAPEAAAAPPPPP